LRAAEVGRQQPEAAHPALQLQPLLTEDVRLSCLRDSASSDARATAGIWRADARKGLS
jgi:hypothetical protein